MNVKIFYQELLDYIGNMKVIDTHEHLESENSRLHRYVDMFNTYLVQYASCDLISAGMNNDELKYLTGNSTDIEKKWEVFKPYWEKAKNTTYCKALIIGTKGIYGIDDINDETYKEIDKEIKKQNKKGLYHHVLKQLCNIEVSILDSDVNCDREFFRSAFRLDNYIRFNSRDAILRAERQNNISINNLSDWTDLIRSKVQEFKTNSNVVCLKTGLAYQRTLKYERTAFSDADRIFNKILTAKDFHEWYLFSPVDIGTKPLEDYLMHTVIQAAAEQQLPVQIHTGLQEGNGNYITNSNPVNLTNICIDYPNARFDIFHAGYPYAGELCAIAKNFRNVYVDLCWSHIISREYTVRFIEELVDTVPMNKIFGFGGDYGFVEGVYGHLKIALENISLALSNKVEKGYISKNEALDIAKRMLYDNPIEFFKLK